MMITILLLIGIGVILLFLIRKIQYYQRAWERRGVPQRPQPFLLGDFGDFLLRRDSIANIIHKVYNAFPNSRYTGMYSMTFPSLVIKDPELIKRITIKDFDHFMNHRPFVPPEVDPFFGKSLISLADKEWKDMRATLSPAFTGSKMKQLFILMEESAENLVKYFEEHPEESSSVEAKDLFTRFANDVIATCAFGITCNSLENKNNDFYTMGKDLTDFGFVKSMIFMAYLVIPKIAKMINLQLFPDKIGKTFSKIVKDSIREREEKSIIRPDMIHILMEAKKGRLKDEGNDEMRDDGFAIANDAQIMKQHSEKAPIDDNDIAAQAMIFFFAGFDSVSTAMTFMCYEILVNTDIQRKLQNEIDETLELNNGKLTYETLTKMKYLDMVVSETLRKWPPTIAADRICTKPYTIEPTQPGEKAVHLNVGDYIAIPSVALQRDPKYYPNPDRFDPERFSEENKSKIDPSTFTPFGIGPRACIGSRFAIQEVKILFAHLLSKFDLVVTEKTQIPIKISSKSATLTTEGGVWFKLKRREV